MGHDDLLAEKLRVDEELRTTKRAIAQARADLKTRGRHLPPGEWHRLQSRQSHLQTMSQRLQKQLHTIKPKDRMSEPQVFCDMAREQMGDEWADALWAKVHAITRPGKARAA